MLKKILGLAPKLESGIVGIELKARCQLDKVKEKLAGTRYLEVHIT